jgi:hypothetical protein
VSSGIVAGGNLIRSLSENSALFYDDGSKRATSSRTDVFERQLYGASHESMVHVASFCHRGIVMSVSIWATHESARKSVDMDSFAADV